MNAKKKKQPKFRSRLIVFDNDDILCDAMDVMLAAAGLKPTDFTDYHTEKNPRIGMQGMRWLRRAFLREELYEQIVYDPSVGRLGEIVELGGTIRIESNTATTQIGEIRRRQLLEHIPALEAKDIRMNVVTQEQSRQKTIPPNTFIFVDDSPYNVAMSTAEINMMRIRRWNVTDKARELVAEKCVIWLPDLDAIINMVCEFLRIRIREDEQRLCPQYPRSQCPYLRG